MLLPSRTFLFPQKIDEQYELSVEEALQNMETSTPEEVQADEEEAVNIRTSEAVTRCRRKAMELAEEMKSIDPNYDRSSKFCREIEGTFSSYDQFVKTKKLDQKKVTSYFKPKEKDDAYGIGRPIRYKF